MQDVDASAAEVAVHFQKMAKRFVRHSFALKVLTAALTSLVVASQLMLAANWTKWTYVGLGAAVAVFVVTLLLMSLDRSSAGELEIARSAIEVARRAQDEAARSAAANAETRRDLRRFQRTLVRPVELYRATFDMTEVVEQAVAASAPVTNTMETLLRVSERSLKIACHFAPEEHFTICIYRAEPDENGEVLLRCIAHLRSVHCDLARARTWRPRQGVGGTAFALQREEVASDMSKDEVRARYRGHPPDADIDHDRYVSLVGVPIMPEAAKGSPWGVVVATSSVPDRFNHHRPRTGTSALEAVRALARIAGLVVSTATLRPG